MIIRRLLLAPSSSMEIIYLRCMQTAPNSIRDKIKRLFLRESHEKVSNNRIIRSS
jgi:hypothetical protein